MSKLFQPVILFALTWLFVILLFSLRLSNILQESISTAWEFYALITITFFSGYTFAFFFKKKVSLSTDIIYNVNEYFFKKYDKFLIGLIILSFIEVIYSKGVPLAWLFIGNGKVYTDYGIPSIHGFTNALGLVLALISSYYYKITKKKKYLIITIGFIIWNIILISRQVIVSLMIEIFVINFITSQEKRKVLLKIIFYMLIIVTGFGILGDLRTGGDAFLALASPSDNWPLWLPSGFLWAYIYVTTPINNLLFNFTFSITHYHYLFPNTLALLFPSVIRNIIFNPADYTTGGDLVTEAFNVSSAFVSPYIDMGYMGIIIFTFAIGIISNLVWWVKGIKRFFYRAILIQILVLSIFYNMFVYLPVVFQFVWIAIFFAGFNKKNDPAYE
ncbi:MAG: O-antigen polymerase [Mucilaginibacter sp.]|uniref:O-antigen polymerase n=1 Tax=Mucilaginibacter sp. TaxID=1882438 RepID=UPI0032650756